MFEIWGDLTLRGVGGFTNFLWIVGLAWRGHEAYAMRKIVRMPDADGAAQQ